MNVEPHEPPSAPALQYRERWSTTIQITGGPDRVVTDKPDPEFKRRPIGFTADLEEDA